MRVILGIGCLQKMGHAVTALCQSVRFVNLATWSADISAGRWRGSCVATLDQVHCVAGNGIASVTLTEGQVLGGGAFSRVSIVTEETTGRQYALKRMRKSAVVQCPEHVFCEQTITRNTAHPFCIRQYGSFQVRSI